MNPVLLDAGPIIAMLNSSDRQHRRCADLVYSIEGELVTCEPVIVEASYLLRHVHGARRDILTNISRGEFQIPLRLTDRCTEVGRLLQKYADVPMDLADACLVDMATVLNTGRILTLDSDFRIYRWGRNRKFDLLIDV